MTRDTWNTWNSGIVFRSTRRVLKKNTYDSSTHERVRIAKKVSHISVLITSRVPRTDQQRLLTSRLTPRVECCNTKMRDRLGLCSKNEDDFSPRLVPRRCVREEGMDVLHEGGPATTRVFLLPRGDARQKCNRWCGATRCNYWGNSRHAGFDADHPDARRRYAVPLHENNPSVPSVEGGAAEIPAGYEAPLPLPSKKRLSPRNVCTYPASLSVPSVVGPSSADQSMERSSDNAHLCLHGSV